MEVNRTDGLFQFNGGRALNGVIAFEEVGKEDILKAFNAVVTKVWKYWNTNVICLSE